MAEELSKPLLVPSSNRSGFFDILVQRTASSISSATSGYTSQPSSFRNRLHTTSLHNHSPLSTTTTTSESYQPHFTTNFKQITMASEHEAHVNDTRSEDLYYSAATSPAFGPIDPRTQVSNPQQPITGPSLIDVDRFLQQNSHILDRTRRQGSSVSAAPGIHASAVNSIPIGFRGGGSQVSGTDKAITRSATIVSTFNETCQTRGLTPVWDIMSAPSPKRPGAPATSYVGAVKIGGQTVVVQEPQPSKKDVKIMLAKRALPVVEVAPKPNKKMKIEKRTKPDRKTVDEPNWVGKLLGRSDDS